MHLAICKNTLFTKVFEKFFNEILFWRTVCTISLFYLKHFGFPGNEMALREDVLTASFLQMSNFCTETQFHLINCLLLEKKLFAKNIKKNPQWAIWPTGDFFWPLIPNLLLRASFCANKKFQAYYGKTAVFRFDVESREKNIVPIKKTNKKQRFWRFFGSSGCNWISLLFVSFKCFVTLAFHAFGDW